MSDEPRAADFTPERPILFRNATVLSMDPAIGVLNGGDVLVHGERIERVGQGIEAPENAVVIDATGGILMPGMVDTHRHMWQTALRGFGADWTLSQYFVFYYLTWGKIFRPEDVYAGNLLSAIEAVDAGVTTSVDWSHGLRTMDHAEAATDALEAVPGRFVLAYGNIFQGAWEWATTPEFRAFYTRRFDGKGDRLGFQLAFDLPGIEGFPEKAAFEVARDLDIAVTTHAGVWAVTGDAGINQMYDGGYMTPRNGYVHSASLSEESYQKIAATGGYASVSTESECNAGQGYSPTWRLRKYGIPITLSNDTSVWWSGDLFAAMRATLNADRAKTHDEFHERGETLTNHQMRAEDAVAYATRGGAKALGLDSSVGSIEAGKKADVVLIKNDNSPVSFPVLHPYGHVVFQANRGDVHTVLVNGATVKHDGKLVGIDLGSARSKIAATVDYLKAEHGPEEWDKGMHPEIPETETLANPYTYRDDVSAFKSKS